MREMRSERDRRGRGRDRRRDAPEAEAGCAWHVWVPATPAVKRLSPPAIAGYRCKHCGAPRAQRLTRRKAAPA